VRCERLAQPHVWSAHQWLVDSLSQVPNSVSSVSPLFYSGKFAAPLALLYLHTTLTSHSTPSTPLQNSLSPRSTPSLHSPVHSKSCCRHWSCCVCLHRSDGFPECNLLSRLHSKWSSSCRVQVRLVVRGWRSGPQLRYKRDLLCWSAFSSLLKRFHFSLPPIELFFSGAHAHTHTHSLSLSPAPLNSFELFSFATYMYLSVNPSPLICLGVNTTHVYTSPGVYNVSLSFQEIASTSTYSPIFATTIVYGRQACLFSLYRCVCVFFVFVFVLFFCLL
jgi:hypothetical protein